MDFKSLTKNQWKSLIVSVLFVIFGVLFCVLAQKMLHLLETILCIAVLIYGGFYLVSYCVVSMGDKDATTLFQAVIAIAFGLLLMFVPSFFVIAISAVIILSGVGYIVSFIKIKKSGIAGGGTNLVCGIILALVGLGLLIVSLVKVDSIIVTIYLGVTLILEGLVNLIALWFVVKKKETATIEKSAEETEQSTEEKRKISVKNK